MKDARDLYGLPLDRFVPERGALAKALRESGQRDQAAEVTGLRKPSIAAWAVNQLVRTQGRAVEALFDAGDALQHAHSQLLAGRADGAALRQALAGERRAVAELAESARGLLSSEGQELTPAMLDRVSETLHAAALDADARMQVKDGCLVRELRHVGLGTGGGGSVPATAAGRRVATQAPSKTAERGAEATSPDKAAATRKQAERDRAKQLSAARKAEADARRVAERATRDLHRAEQRRDDAAQSLREAEDALAAARQRAEQAAGAHRRSQQELERVSAASPRRSP